MSVFADRMDAVQDLWRKVHRIAAEKALSSQGLAVLRAWAGGRARELPAVVFYPDRPAVVRPSFLVALAHASDEIAQGRIPE